MSNSTDKKISILFLGVSGSGKSTIAQELERYLEENNIAVVNRYAFSEKFSKVRRYAMSACYALSGGESLRALLSFVIFFFRMRPLDNEEPQRYTASIKAYLARNFILRAINSQVYIFDEGLLNHIVHIDSKKLSNKNVVRKMLEPLLFSAGSTPLVIYVETATEVAIQRARKDFEVGHNEGRSGIFTELSEEEMRHEFYENRGYNERALFTIIEEKIDSIYTLKLSGVESPKENARQIVDVVNEMLNK